MEDKLKQYDEDQEFLKKFKSEYVMSGCYCMGEFCDVIEFKLIKSKIFFNWETLSMKIKIFKEEKSILLDIYSRWMWIGEWGEDYKKPIIFMEITTKNFTYKSKKILSVKDIFKMTNKSKVFDLNIYFETIIEEDPRNSTYKENNNIWISYVGGLYDVIDPSFWLEKAEDKTKIVEEASITKTNMMIFEKLCDETANTAIEMRENSRCKWTIFASEYLKHLVINKK